MTNADDPRTAGRSICNFGRVSRVPDSRAQGGATVIEFAIVCLLFFQLTFAIIEFGRAAWSSSLVTQASKEVARCATVRGSNYTASVSTTIAESRECAKPWLSFLGIVTDSQVASAVQFVMTTNTPGSTFEVTVSHRFTSVLFDLVLPNSVDDYFDLRSSTRMIIVY